MHRFQKTRFFAACKKGATAIEYGLIAAGIALVITTAINLMGTSISDVFTQAADSLDTSGGGSGGHHGGPVSDRRLKHDIHFVKKLPNGLKLYRFKYLKDEKTFVGVMAQDLLAEQGFRSSVIKLPSGYYAVDYNQLGISVADENEMRATGRRALSYALSKKKLHKTVFMAAAP